MKSALSLMLPASVVAVPHIPGSARARLIEMQGAAIQHHALTAGAWTDTAFYVVAVLLVLAILGLIVKCVKGPPRPGNLMEVAQAQAELDMQLKELQQSEKELKEHQKRLGQDVEEPEEEETEQVDYEGALRMAAQVVAQTVGPKVAKGQAIKTILESRVDSLTKQTKSFVLDELNGTAGAVLNEIGAEEAMLLLDPQKALDGNFPPAAVLLAGVMSPVIMALTALNHILQALLHFLPIVCLCIAAVIIDQGSVCFIPYMTEWCWAHIIMGTILFLAHICQVVKVVMARSALTAEIGERQEDIKKLTKNKTPSVDDVRNVFISICVIVQKALQSEDAVRRSFFNLIVGLGTMIWILMTIWTFVIVVGYTFVPGVIAFHESAKETAGDEYCGTWMSVLAARLCCIIGVVFLLINIMIVSQWFADGMRYQPGYVETVLKQAKKQDDQAGGIPVMQTLVKAFVLRGSSDTLEVQKSCAKQDEYRLAADLSVAEAELAKCQGQLSTVESTLTGLESETAKMPPRGFVQVKKPEPTPAGPGMADQAQDAVADAIRTGEDAVKQGEKVLKEQSAKAQVALDEAKKQAEEQLEKAKEQGEEALAEAQKAADAAIAAATEQADKMKAAFESIDYEDLKRQAELKKQEAILAAKELQAATKEKLNEMLELIMKKLEELKNSDTVKQAIEEATKRAEEAKAKLKEIAESEEMQAALAGDLSLAQAKAEKLAAEAKAAAEQAYENFDSEEAKKAAMEAAEKLQAQAKEAAEQAKVAAEKAAAAAQEQGEKAMVVAKEQGDKAVVAAKEGAEKAKVVAQEQGEKAVVAAKEGAEKASVAAAEGAEKAKAAAKDGAEKAKATAEKTVKKK